jgi:hypothetical protein
MTTTTDTTPREPRTDHLLTPRNSALTGGASKPTAPWRYVTPVDRWQGVLLALDLYLPAREYPIC